MLPKDWELLDIQMDGLRRHVDMGRPLIAKAKDADPDPVEVLALSAFLHGFYNGVERVLSVIARGTGERRPGMPKSEMWHQQLLDSMTVAADKRPPLFTPEQHRDMFEYLRFRHVFRHAYWEELQWSRMRPLVLDLLRVYETFLASVEAFRRAMADSNSGGKI